VLNLSRPISAAIAESAYTFGAASRKRSNDKRARGREVIDNAIRQCQGLLSWVIDLFISESAARQRRERPYVSSQTSIRMRSPLLTIFGNSMAKAIGAFIRFSYLPKIGNWIL
jgi:hypothetical protein